MRRRVSTSAIAIMLALLCQQYCKAQDTPATSTGDLRFYVDHAGFQGRNGRTHEEFYLMLYADQLQYLWRDAKQCGMFKVTTSLANPQGQEASRDTWTTEADIVGNSTDLKTLAIYDRWAQELAPGSYVLTVHLSDENGPNHGRARLALDVPEIKEGQFAASQIEFVAHAEPHATLPHFVKGNRTIIPNPSRRYGLLNPILYLYYELYSLPESSGEEFNVTYSVHHADGQMIKTYPTMPIRKPGSSASLLHGLDVSGLPSGLYTLALGISDIRTGQTLSLSRRFEVIQLDYFGLQPTLTAEQAELAGRHLKYTASAAEQQLYQRLTLAGKAQFLTRFWRDRDPTPGTLQNEYLQQVQQRYQYANEHFGWGKEEGWASDRGRVLVQYGMPGEFKRYHAEAETVPFEIWVYSEERSYEFVFADLQSNGRFVLLHSNRENEVHDHDWARLIKRL